MGLRTLNPTTPGVRGRIAPDFAELTQGNSPLKSLTESKSSPGGRNHFGRITSRFRGGGHKRRFRTIDFRRDKIGVPAKVASIEYDPNRSARIVLLNYADGEKRYILWPLGLKIGDTVLSSREADIKPGNSLPLRFIPLATFQHHLRGVKRGRSEVGQPAIGSAGA
jgi:large subunit ribosomal protein L2